MAENQQKAAFRAIARDDAGALAGIFGNCPVGDWTKWENQAGQSLLALCKERGAFQSYALLADALGLSAGANAIDDNADPSVKAFRAVARDDMTALADALGGLSADVWLKWRNKANKDLLTMSKERKSKGAHATLRKAMVAPIKVEKASIKVVPPQAGPSSASAEKAAEPCAVPSTHDAADDKSDRTPAKAEPVAEEVKAPVEEVKEAQAPPAATHTDAKKPADVAAEKAQAEEARKKSAEDAKKRMEERHIREKAEEEKKAKEKAELDAKLARQAKKVEDEGSQSAAAKAADPAQEEAARLKKAEDEAAAKKAADEAAKLAQEAEKGQKKEEEEAAKKAADDAAKLAQQEAEAKQKKHAEDAKKAAEDARRKEEDAAKQAAADAEKAAKERDAIRRKEEEAKRAAEEAACMPPALVSGDLQKKGQGGMFHRAWKPAHVVVKEGKLSVYTAKSEVGKKEPQAVIDFRAGECEAVADPPNSTQISIRPRSGNWTGQDFKSSETFVFDATTNMTAWLESINAHCQFATRMRKMGR